MIMDATGNVVETITGKVDNYTSEYVDGDHLTVKFTSDSSVNGQGWVIDKMQVINAAPASSDRRIARRP